MRVQQVRWSGTQVPAADLARLAALDPHLLLCFGPSPVLEAPAFLSQVRGTIPAARLVGCSSAGVLTREGAFEGETVLTALHLGGAEVHIVREPLEGMADSEAAGARLGQALRPLAPTSALLLGQGVNINGSALVRGFQSVFGTGVPLCGALAGDDGAFRRTVTVLDDEASDRHLLAVGFRGVGFETTSTRGWEPFGPLRRVTAARDNILEALDGEPALAVYRRYLGDWAAGLPGSALLFPLGLLEGGPGSVGLVRTVLGVDETAGHLILAGDLPAGSHVRLMHASTTSLVAGVRQAATGMRPAGDALALVFSCVGRKLVMGQRVDEEVMAVSEGLGGAVPLAGFFSYGEIGPMPGRPGTFLHNQSLSMALLTGKA